MGIEKKVFNVILHFSHAYVIKYVAKKKIVIALFTFLLFRNLNMSEEYHVCEVKFTLHL